MTDEAAPGRTTYLNVGEHFNRMAPRYDDGCGKVAWNGPQILMGALANFPMAANSARLKVVDFGAGTGLVGQLFKEQAAGTHVTGIDLADLMLEEVIKHGRIDVGHVGGIDALAAIGTGSADIVTASGVLDFIEDTDRLAGEFARVLKVGGHFALTYEPAGTAQDGVKSLQHSPATLSRQFAIRGCNILLDRSCADAYTNFRTGRPVTNHVMVGRLDHRCS